MTSTNRAWEAEDSMKIEDFFRKMEKCHKKRKIEEAFNEEKSLNDILKRERMKCLEKVKNLFKKWNKS